MALKYFNPPALPLAPTDYSQEYFNQLVRSLNIFLKQIGSTTPIEVDQILLRSLPTSPTGLPLGTVWNNQGVLYIVINIPVTTLVGSATITGVAPTITIA